MMAVQQFIQYSFIYDISKYNQVYQKDIIIIKYKCKCKTCLVKGLKTVIYKFKLKSVSP